LNRRQFLGTTAGTITCKTRSEPRSPGIHSSKCRLLVLIVVLLSEAGLYAQNYSQPAYWNTSLSPEKRAADLVQRMTVEEKVSQLVNQSRAIPRLNVPDYDWWSEALHGVANNGGITTFPEPVGLAATFDPDIIHRMAIATSIEARIKYVEGMNSA
jgi:beta-glucosidase